jgi:hypothetical protein
MTTQDFRQCYTRYILILLLWFCASPANIALPVVATLILAFPVHLALVFGHIMHLQQEERVNLPTFPISLSYI